MRILQGRFGPYIKHEDINANVPRGKDPQEVTLDEAVALIAEREAKGRRSQEKNRPARRPRPRLRPTRRRPKPPRKRPRSRRRRRKSRPPRPPHRKKVAAKKA